MRSFVNGLIAWGPLGLLILSALDSAGIPLPAGVDALIVVLCAQSPESAWLCVAMAVAGSMAGNLFLFYLARKGGEMYLEKHIANPRGQKFRQWFQRYGLLTVFIPVLVPIPMPMKLFILCAGALGVKPWAFALTVLAARVSRYGGLAYLGVKLQHDAPGYLRSHAWQLAGVAAGLFVFLYVLIRLRDLMYSRQPRS